MAIPILIVSVILNPYHILYIGNEANTSLCRLVYAALQQPGCAL
jgi:hypothetical protein